MSRGIIPVGLPSPATRPADRVHKLSAYRVVALVVISTRLLCSKIHDSPSHTRGASRKQKSTPHVVPDRRHCAWTSVSIGLQYESSEAHMLLGSVRLAGVSRSASPWNLKFEKESLERFRNERRRLTFSAAGGRDRFWKVVWPSKPDRGRSIAFF